MFGWFSRRRICYVKQPILRAHLDTLHALEEMDSTVQWAAAGRSRMRWVSEIFEILAELSNPKTLGKLSFQRDGSANTFFKLQVSFGSVRVWSLLSYILPPEQWSGIVSNDAEASFSALDDDKKCKEVFEKALAVSRDEDHPESKVALLLSLLFAVCA